MLRVRIHHQSDTSDFSLVWDKVLSGRIAENLVSNLERVEADAMLQGELLSLRIKDGEGGGCETIGAFLDLKMKKTDDNFRTADVYFDADKWRTW